MEALKKAGHKDTYTLRNQTSKFRRECADEIKDELHINFVKKTLPAKNTTIHKAYIFIVRENVSATKPTIAGAMRNEENPMVVKLVTVVGILSDDCLTA